MAVYCFKCKTCGAQWTSQEFGHICPDDRPDVVRDYRAEAVGIGEGVRVSRTGTDRELASLFLPGNDEFVGPGDPDGKKGAREWLETHQPKESRGSNPLLNIDRRSF